LKKNIYVNDGKEANSIDVMVNRLIVIIGNIINKSKTKRSIINGCNSCISRNRDEGIDNRIAIYLVRIWNEWFM